MLTPPSKFNRGGASIVLTRIVILFWPISRPVVINVNEKCKTLFRRSPALTAEFYPSTGFYHIPTVHPFWVGSDLGWSCVPDTSPRHQGEWSWEFRAITRFPGFLPASRAPPPINISAGGCPPVGKHFEGAGYPYGWPHHLKFINIFILLYIITILLACKKSVTTKMSEKIWKNHTL